MIGSRTPIRSALIVGFVGMLFGGVLAARSLGSVDWDPTLFTSFGEEATATREYGEEKLGEVYLRAAQGHDGKFYFVQANDPWVLDPDENAEVLDRPLYRSQRMFYPVLAGGFGVFQPTTIAWALLIVNIVAMGVGSFAVAMVALRMGGSPWFGLAFGLNFGLISEMYIDGAGIVAAAAAFGAVALFLGGRTWWGIGLLSVAVLTREAMLIAAAGSAYWFWRKGDRHHAVATAAVPAMAVVLWAIYIRIAIEFEIGTGQVQEIGWPFVGFLQSVSQWTQDPLDLLAGVGTMLVLLVLARRVVRSDDLVGWAFLGFVPLALVFTQQVWHSWFDISRAVAPLFTAFVLLVFLGAPATRPTNSLAEAQT